MNAQPEGLHTDVALSRCQGLLASSLDRLRSFRTSQKELRDALDCVESLGNSTARKAAGKLRRQLDRFEPSVTMIGQIKSGKTTLVNTMIGWPELLPADVNPWTSVVTSVHLSTLEPTQTTRARFQFFSNDEWDRLVRGGGRIGELADRAGADNELAKIMEQANHLREKAKARLGRKFELLLGSEQSYSSFDQELVARYVCLGDETDEDNRKPFKKVQGYFADITRAADLYLHQPATPVNLCVRDTPGVNDTFLVREQITIKAIRDSRICVVVLSAHQALSSTDMALVRLIANVRARQIIIFVNRIDELSDPGTQVPQIKESIQQTLQAQKGPSEATLIFGSALWAHASAVGDMALLSKPSQEALFNWAEATAVVDTHDGNPHALIWELSGLPALYDAIAERVVDCEGGPLLEKAAQAAANLIKGIKASDNLDAKSGVTEARLRLPLTEFEARLLSIQRAQIDALQIGLEDANAAFSDRVERSRQSFLSRATESLAKHLEFYGEDSPWSYDPTGLRLLLNSAYKSFGIKSQATYSACAEAACADLKELFHAAFDLPAELFDPQFPAAPPVPPPVAIGQTIALDLRGSWWKGWWARRQSYEAQAMRFHDLIRAETESLVDDLTKIQAQAVNQALTEQLEDFLEEQISNLGGLVESSGAGAVSVDQLLDIEKLRQRASELDAGLAGLQRYME